MFNCIRKKDKTMNKIEDVDMWAGLNRWRKMLTALWDFGPRRRCLWWILRNHTIMKSVLIVNEIHMKINVKHYKLQQNRLSASFSGKMHRPHGFRQQFSFRVWQKAHSRQNQSLTIWLLFESFTIYLLFWQFDGETRKLERKWKVDV